MTDKELKKLRRSDLLEMLITQSKEVESLKKQLQEANEKLENREIAIANAGSIAEAALGVNQIFEIAQKTADQYLENIQRAYGAEQPIQQPVYQQAVAEQPVAPQIPVEQMNIPPVQVQYEQQNPWYPQMPVQQIPQQPVYTAPMTAKTVKPKKKTVVKPTRKTKR